MPDIVEYQHKLSNGKTVRAYKGLAKCRKCGKEHKLETVDPEVFNNFRCFECSMKKETK